MSSATVAMFRTLRPHQWAKNGLLALPLVMSHRLGDVAAWRDVGLAIVAFSLASSALYIVNDLVDRRSDRQHPQKKHRPIASGALSPSAAIWLLGACALVCVAMLFNLPPAFPLCVAAYGATSLAYSLWLKRLLMIDVLTLASLYTLRLLAGGVAAAVEISPWLMALSMFLFLSLAFAKRYAELRSLNERGEATAMGRAYHVVDLDLIRTLGPTSGYLAVLVFALYINSPESQALYPKVELLWGICPLLLYWLTRLWFFAQRGRLHHDPVVFALTDRVSFVVASLIVILAVLAARGGQVG